jgi:hypothetical protein
MKKYLNLFDTSQKVDYRIEVLSGLTVALALVPEAVAFALIAGLSPLTGLYAEEWSDTRSQPGFFLRRALWDRETEWPQKAGSGKEAGTV